jgi:hypothetical protein
MTCSEGTACPGVNLDADDLLEACHQEACGQVGSYETRNIFVDPSYREKRQQHTCYTAFFA